MKKIVAVAIALLPAVAAAQEEEGELEDLSLEQLLSMDLQVTSVSKRAESIGDSAAAVYAITSDELRRTGHTSIAESLRIVPGLHVARLDASGWAISARGFNGRFNNKMLVLVDGRTGYTPLFGGVFWDVQDVFLDDIERIEVIRGPGGTLWGANAVNGVINVTTRPAAMTQGLTAFATAGVEERFGGGARWGGKMGDAVAYRVYAKYFDRDGGSDAFGHPTHDAWSAGRGGFRIDWARRPGAMLTFQGDAYSNRDETIWVRDILQAPYTERVEDVTPADGGNALLRWSEPLGEKSRVQVQTYWDHTSRADVRGGEVRDTQDLDVQWQSTLREHRIIAGGGVRSTTNVWDDRQAVSMDPDTQTDVLINLYAQDEVRWFKDTLRLTFGSKFEHNEFTGFEVSPNARVTLRPTENQTAWAAVSRAVRTPNRINRDSTVAFRTFVANPPLYVIVVGNPELKSETVISSEAGWRGELPGRVSVDIAGFYNHHDDNIVVDEATALPPYQGTDGAYYLPVPWTNGDDASVRGLEIAARWIVTPQWVIAAGYTWLDPSMSPVIADPADTPRNQATMRWYMNVSDAIEWNIAMYYRDPTGRAENANIVSSYLRLDIGFDAEISKRFRIAVWGQNLLAEQHAESRDVFLFPATEIDRSFYARLTTHW